MNRYKAALALILLLVLSACYNTKVWRISHQDILESEYVRFRPPTGKGW